MIIKYYEVNKINISKNRYILFYGKNDGLKSEKNSEIISLNRENKVFKYDEKEILENKENFYENILSGSLFENKKLIIISRATDKILPIIDYLKNNENIKDTFILNASILDKKSKLRSTFEKDKKFICVAFYPDNNETLAKLTKNFLSHKKILMSSENVNLIINKCGNDRGNLKNELEKIEIFAQNKKKIETLEIMKLINLSENYSINELIDTCLSKNKRKTINILNENNFVIEDCIIIIRTFMNKSKRILKLLNDYQENKDLNKVISNAKPPIFWKDKDIVKQQLKNWTPEKISQIIYNLNKIELQIKKGGLNALNVVTDFILEQSSLETNN